MQHLSKPVFEEIQTKALLINSAEYSPSAQSSGQKQTETSNKQATPCHWQWSLLDEACILHSRSTKLYLCSKKTIHRLNKMKTGPLKPSAALSTVSIITLNEHNNQYYCAKQYLFIQQHTVLPSISSRSYTHLKNLQTHVLIDLQIYSSVFDYTRLQR